MTGVKVIAGSLDDGDGLWGGWRRFVPRVNPYDRAAVAEISEGAIAKPLHQSVMDAQLLLFATQSQSLLPVLEPEAWRNQRARKDRGKTFNAMGLGTPPRPINPAVFRTATLQDLTRYVEPFLDGQRAHGAAAVLTPSHQAGGHGDPGREGELRLAEFGARLAISKGVCVREDRSIPLLIETTLDVAELDTPQTAARLAASYSSLPGDGFWVHLAHLSEISSPERIAAATTFLFALQDLSGRRVFAVDCKNLVWPLLAAGLWGGSIGVAAREQFEGFELKDDPARDKQSNKKKGGRTPSVVHRVLLRNFRATHIDAERAFKAFPCECGAHSPKKVPAGNPQISCHDTRNRLVMASEATGANAEAAVRLWLVEAGWAAADLELPQPAVNSYEAVFNSADWVARAAG